MKQELKNFYDLFQEDDAVVYQALLAKKDLILRKVFMPCNTQTPEDSTQLPDTHALMNKTIGFDTLKKDQVFTSKDKIERGIELFNDQFRVCYFYNQPYQIGDSHSFWVELDFNKIDDQGYKQLVANFFKVLKKEDLEFTFDFKDIKEIMKLAMCHSKADYLLLIDKSNLISDRYYYAPIVTRIVVYKNADEETVKLLLQLAEALEIQLEVI